MLAALAIVAAGCTGNIPEPGTVHNLKVEKVVLDEELSSGLDIIIGKTYSLPEHISAYPAEATNTAQRYESSDPSVADVSEKGILSANKVGSCVVTVYVGMEGVCDEFTVNVNPVPPVDIEKIVFVAMEDEYQFLDGMNLTIDLKKKVSVSPDDYSEAVVFSSSNPSVASVDDFGVLTVHSLGETTLTASAERHPDVNATRLLKVVPLEKAEWERSGWTMTCSQNPLPNPGGRNNSLTAMLDGKQIVNRSGKNDADLTNGTAFCIDVPGRNSLANVDKENHEIYFIIDMKQTLPVNYFRISNISTHKDDVVVRYKGFTEISGSNDGENFEVIQTNLDFTDKQNVKINDTPEYNRETENIRIPTTQYRYLKFMMKGLSCYGPLGRTGGTAQIEEFYLGYDKDLVNEPEPVEVNISSLSFSKSELEYELAAMSGTVDLSSMIAVEPADHTEGYVFESSDNDAVSVTADGTMTVSKLTPGVTVKVSAANHPEVNATLTVKAYKLIGQDYARFVGDGTDSPSDPREYLMSMTCSQDPLPNTGGRNNSLTAMLDGRPIDKRTGASNDEALTNGTAFCIDVPGRNSLSSVEDKENYEIYFIIDLKKQTPVNYFRISNISDHADDMVVRFKAFTEISGSNDGTSFTVIQQNLDFTDKQNVETGTIPNSTKKAYNRTTANIEMNEANYRYLKFMMKGTSCYGPLGKTGGTAQIEEFYLGYSKTKVYSE